MRVRRRGERRRGEQALGRCSDDGVRIAWLGVELGVGIGSGVGLGLGVGVGVGVGLGFRFDGVGITRRQHTQLTG